MVWSSSLFIKEANTESYVTWHQDLTYWGLDDAEEVTAWFALSPSNVASGCMRFVPGSHMLGVIEHKHLEDFRVEDEDFDYSKEVCVSLKAGGCSFHHSLALHRTDTNVSDEPRIGLTVAYMAATSKYIGKPPKPDFVLIAGKGFEGCV